MIRQWVLANIPSYSPEYWRLWNILGNPYITLIHAGDELEVSNRDGICTLVVYAKTEGSVILG